MASSEKLKRKFQNALKLSGFPVRREFCNQVIDRFKEKGIDLSSENAFETILKNFTNSLESQEIVETSIEQPNIDKAIEACLHSGFENSETVFNVINAFDFPKFSYDPDRKQYFQVKQKSNLLPDAGHKAKLFLERYSTVLQRTKRNFKENLRNEEKLHLQTVDYLLTISSVKLENTLILGMLILVMEGKYCLEDPTGMVELNLKHAKYHEGFISENCIVLANGYYEDKVLYVSTIILPPGEEYSRSRLSFGNLNYFGGPSNIPLKDSQKLKEHLQRNQNEMIMFFSDLWLDLPAVFEKLQVLFEGIQDSPPIAFVFMGNYLSVPHGSEQINALRKAFKTLADLLSNYSNIIANSQIVFVPGLADPSAPFVAPRPGLPKVITEEFLRTVPRAIFASNPCRLQYCNREIVLFRANLVSKFYRNALFKPKKEDIADSITKTIISQGHLSPMGLNILSVHWDFDYCLRLFPLPDLIVIGDKAESYQGKYKGCQVVNPGSFYDSGFQFKAYTPYSQTLDDCVL